MWVNHEANYLKEKRITCCRRSRNVCWSISSPIWKLPNHVYKSNTASREMKRIPGWDSNLVFVWYEESQISKYVSTFTFVWVSSHPFTPSLNLYLKSLYILDIRMCVWLCVCNTVYTCVVNSINVFFEEKIAKERFTKNETHAKTSSVHPSLTASWRTIAPHGAPRTLRAWPSNPQRDLDPALLRSPACSHAQILRWIFLPFEVLAWSSKLLNHDSRIASRIGRSGYTYYVHYCIVMRFEF